jgi:hypothetical protein
MPTEPFSTGAFALSAIIGGMKSGKIFLVMLTEITRQEYPISVKRCEDYGGKTPQIAAWLFRVLRCHWLTVL